MRLSLRENLTPEISPASISMPSAYTPRSRLLSSMGWMVMLDVGGNIRLEVKDLRALLFIGAIVWMVRRAKDDKLHPEKYKHKVKKQKKAKKEEV